MNIITASMDNRDIQPHAAFQHVSPDDVMNCWDEADRAICNILWKGHLVYVEMTARQNKEDGWCPSSWTSEFNMAHPRIWAAFTKEEQYRLNVMAARHQKADDEWWESIQAAYEN